jgi:RNA polymerase sigma-70 factor, ECF subfamily
MSHGAITPRSLPFTVVSDSLAPWDRRHSSGRPEEWRKENAIVPQDVNEQLVTFLPRLRIWAFALTRNRAAADDLAQDVAAKVLRAQDCFVPGTNFSAWVHRIMLNHFISSVRNRREFTEVNEIPEQPTVGSHEDRTALRELSWAVRQLPPDQREALSMIALQEIPYETAAEKTGCAIGTLKSRVHRARLQLRAYMLGEEECRTPSI